MGRRNGNLIAWPTLNGDSRISLRCITILQNIRVCREHAICLRVISVMHLGARLIQSCTWSVTQVHDSIQAEMWGILFFPHKSHHGPTNTLQGIEDEILGDVGQEVELIAHAPMFDKGGDSDQSDAWRQCQ